MSIHLTICLNDKEKITVKFNTEITVGDVRELIMLNIMFKKYPILYKVPFCLSKCYNIRPNNVYDLIHQHNCKHISNIMLFEVTWLEKLHDDYTLSDLIQNNTITIGKCNNILVIVTPKYSYFKKVYNTFFTRNKIKTEQFNMNPFEYCNINHLVKFMPIDILSH
jgi:hypothetical protein